MTLTKNHVLAVPLPGLIPMALLNILQDAPEAFGEPKQAAAALGWDLKAPEVSAVLSARPMTKLGGPLVAEIGFEDIRRLSFKRAAMVVEVLVIAGLNEFDVNIAARMAGVAEYVIRRARERLLQLPAKLRAHVKAAKPPSIARREAAVRGTKDNEMASEQILRRKDRRTQSAGHQGCG